MKKLRFLIAAVIVALCVGTPAVASADEAACQPTYLARDGRELFTLDAKYIPPPLRAFPADCASRLVDAPFETGAGIQVAYALLYTDVTLATVLDILDSFEQAGWISGAPVGALDLGNDLRADEPLTTDQVRELGGDPVFLRARFGDEATGLDIIEMTYANGGGYSNDETILTPSLVVTVLTNRVYGFATGIADPSVLSDLRTIPQAAPSPTQTAVLCTAAVMLMLIVGWPSSLLNSVISSRYNRIFGWVKRGMPARISAALRKTQPRWLVWVGFVAAAIVAGFVDPNFGVNLMSLRMLVSGFLGFLVFNVLGWWLVARVVRRIQPDAEPVVNFRWGSLLVVLAAVLVARLLEFSPGVIFGLVAGLSFAVALAASRKAIVVLVGSGFALAAALVGWVLYSLLAPVAEGAPGNFLLVFGTEFLSGVTIEGVSTLPLALLPLAALDGADLLSWKKWVWAVGYAVGLAAFMLVLLTIPASWGTMPGDFFRWIAIFLGYAVVAVALWVINTALTRRRAAAPA